MVTLWNKHSGPVALMSFVVYTQTDPYAQLSKDVFGLQFNLNYKPLITIIRIILVLIVTTECSKAYPVSILIYIIWFHIFAFCTQRISSWSGKNLGRHSPRLSDCIALYRTSQVLYALIRLSMEFILLMVFETFFALIISANYLSLTSFRILDFPLYLTFPPLSVLAMAEFVVMMPMCCSLYEDTKDLILFIKVRAKRSWSREYFMRAAKSLHPIRVNGGINGYAFLNFQRSFKFGFFDLLMNQTINALMVK